MNSITRYFSILVLPILLYSNLKKSDNYISFEYSYDHTEKPTSTIVFYTNTFSVNEMTFVGSRFKIKQQEFDSVESIIKKRSSYIIIDSLARRYVSITVAKNGKKIVYGTVNLNKTKQVVGEIRNKLQGSKSHSEINKAFEELFAQLTRLGDKGN